jgi:transcriptional regulator with XRE-family HTH domain
MGINALATYIEKQGVTQAKVAKAIGAAQAMVSDWASDKRHPSVHYALKLESWSKGEIPVSSWAGRRRAPRRPRKTA